MSATTCRVCNERIIANAHECPPEQSLRDRCERLYIDLFSYPHPAQDERMVQAFEAFAREIARQARQEALEEAAKACDRSKNQWRTMDQTETIAARANEALMNAAAIRALKTDALAAQTNSKEVNNENV